MTIVTAILGVIVLFFATHLGVKKLGSFLLSRAAGVATEAVVGGGAAAIVADVQKAFNKTPTSTAMAGFVVNVEDFGKVVFGSEAKLIEAVSQKTIGAVAEKLSTPEGKTEVAKRLASISKKAAQ